MNRVRITKQIINTNVNNLILKNICKKTFDIKTGRDMVWTKAGEHCPQMKISHVLKTH